MAGFLKLGAAQYNYLWDYSLEDSLRKIKKFGFRYIELMTTPPHFWPRGFSDKKRKDLKSLLDQLELELIAINPTFNDLNLASPNPGIREETVIQIKEQITLARDLGAKIVGIIGGRRHPLLAPPVETIWKEFARDAILRCVEHAEKNNVIFGLENSPSLFIDSAERMVFVVEEVKSPWIKIVFDVANDSLAAKGGTHALEMVKEHLVHVHLSDTDGKKRSHSPVGMGTIDFAAIAEKLKEINFTGVSILETTYAEDPGWGISSSLEKLIPLGWQL